MAVNQTFTDIDQHAAQMAGFEQHYVQLSRGAFHGVFTSVALPRGIGFDVEWVAPALHQQASVPPRTASLVTFLDLGGRAIFNGHDVMRLDTVFLPPGASLDVRTPPNARIAVVTLPVDLLENECSAWAGPLAARRSIGAARLLDAATCASQLQPVLLPLVHALDSPPNPGFAETTIAASLATGLLDTTLRLLNGPQAPDEPLAVPSARRRRDAFALTTEAINRFDSSELSIGSLCRMAGVSRRTLEYCFEEAVAMSPLQYLKTARLNGVRRDLRAAADTDTTIGDVAAKYGIWHLGRLSREYAQLFGELPSATLHRGHRPRSPHVSRARAGR